MTTLIRKLTAPFGHMTLEHMDAVESGVVSGLSGLVIGFASRKIPSASTPFALIGAGLIANAGVGYTPLRLGNRETVRTAGDAAIAIGFSKLGEKFAGMGASAHGDHFGMLETSSSFGSDPLQKLAAKL
jgi:hypothetical protein